MDIKICCRTKKKAITKLIQKKYFASCCLCLYKWSVIHNAEGKFRLVCKMCKQV